MFLRTGIRNVLLSQQTEKQNAFNCRTLLHQKASEKELPKIKKSICATDLQRRMSLKHAALQNSSQIVLLLLTDTQASSKHKSCFTFILLVLYNPDASLLTEHGSRYYNKKLIFIKKGEICYHAKVHVHATLNSTSVFQRKTLPFSQIL